MKKLFKVVDISLHQYIKQDILVLIMRINIGLHNSMEINANVNLGSNIWR